MVAVISFIAFALPANVKGIDSAAGSVSWQVTYVASPTKGEEVITILKRCTIPK